MIVSTASVKVTLGLLKMLGDTLSNSGCSEVNLVEDFNLTKEEADSARLRINRYLEPIEYSEEYPYNDDTIPGEYIVGMLQEKLEEDLKLEEGL